MSDMSNTTIDANVRGLLATTQNGFIRAVKDCASGTVGGIVQVFVGQVKKICIIPL